MIKPEILAPAGSFEALTAAVRSGADAVYFGTGNFNARRNASNFSGDDLQRAVDFCHERNVKVHITLNTLVKDSEMSELKESVRRICKSGADALILQDLGVLRARKGYLSRYRAARLHPNVGGNVGRHMYSCRFRILKSCFASRIIKRRD